MRMSTPLPRSLLRLATAPALALLTLLGSPASLAQNKDTAYRIVVPYASGGGTDSIARLLAKELQASLAAPVLVDNRAGAGGMRHVAYRGSAPALTDVLASRVHLLYSSVSVVLPHIQAGTLRALAVTGEQRSALLPDVPTLAEAAGLKGVKIEAWYGVFAPAGVPPADVRRLNAAVNQALDSAELRSFIETQEAGVVRKLTPQAMGQMLRDDSLTWKTVVEQAKVAID